MAPRLCPTGPASKYDSRSFLTPAPGREFPLRPEVHMTLSTRFLAGLEVAPQQDVTQSLATSRVCVARLARLLWTPRCGQRRRGSEPGCFAHDEFRFLPPPRRAEPLLWCASGVALGLVGNRGPSRRRGPRRGRRRSVQPPPADLRRTAILGRRTDLPRVSRPAELFDRPLPTAQRQRRTARCPPTEPSPSG